MFEIYVKERYIIMPREIKRITDDTSSSSSIGGKSARDAHHPWLRPMQTADPRNFHNVLFPEEARRLGLIADAQPGTTQQPDVPTSRASVPSSSYDTGKVHTTVEQKPTSDRPHVVIDCRKVDSARLLTMAVTMRDANSSLSVGEAKRYYQKIARHLDYVLEKTGAERLYRRFSWLEGTEPPSDPNVALSEAVKSMNTPFQRMSRENAQLVQTYADEIKDWMKR
jgi:hypothetical protein